MNSSARIGEKYHEFGANTASQSVFAITLSFFWAMVVAFVFLGFTSRIATAEESKFEDFDQRNFGEGSTKIDNEWWPLQPGMQFIYEGEAVEDGKSTPHRVIFTVTGLTKVIDGVRTVVIFDRDYSEGNLVESELAFFAQDNDGNVWHLGQYRETYDDAELIGGRAWLVGHLEGAKAGIMMKAKPLLGKPSYSQGFAPAPFYWTDRARTAQMGQKVTVPAGSYENVLVSDEFNFETSGSLQTPTVRIAHACTRAPCSRRRWLRVMRNLTTTARL
jgi:hypothetical protein